MSDEAHVIDSYAWLGHFSGSTAGARAKPSIESSKGMTPTIVVAELSEKSRREKLHLGADLNFITVRIR